MKFVLSSNGEGKRGHASGSEVHVGIDETHHDARQVVSGREHK